MELDDKHLTMLRMMGADRKPSLREMGKAVGMTIGGIQHRVRELALAGYIGRAPGMARGNVLTEKGKLALTKGSET